MHSALAYLTFLLAPLGSCSNLPSPDGLGLDSAPLRWSSVGTPMVQVEIDGDPYWFWIDTGAGRTVINERLATKLGWRPVVANQIEIGTATKTIVGGVFTVPTLALVGRKVPNLECLVLGSGSLEIPLFGFIPWVSISGIIGWDLLQQGRWTIDKTQNRVSWSDSHPSARGLAEWDGLPILVDPQGRRLGLDTGANRSFLTPEGAEALFPDRQEDQKFTWLGAAGGGESRAETRIRSVNWEWAGTSWYFDEIRIRKQHLSQTSLVGILGADLFTKTTRLVIDWPNRALTWGP